MLLTHKLLEYAYKSSHTIPRLKGPFHAPLITLSSQVKKVGLHQGDIHCALLYAVSVNNTGQSRATSLSETHSIPASMFNVLTFNFTIMFQFKQG